MRHDEKYILINQGFAGKQRLMPFFNRQNNDDLILAIQAAGVSRGRNGFRKDKGGENWKSLNTTKINPTWSKLAESEEDLLEISCQREQSGACSNYAEWSRYYATPNRWHRCFDSLYIGAEKFPYRESYASPTTGIL